MQWDPDFFEQHGYCVIDEAIPVEDVAEIRQTISALMEAEAMKRAGIGKEGTFELDNAKRGDFIKWIDPENAENGTKRYLDLIDSLIQSLNREFYMGVRDFECHYTQYPEGTRYMVHSDRHKHGSHRIVSFVFYLNENWQKSDGGELIVYLENGDKMELLPQAGRLILFRSELLHEVLVTHRVRQSITGWMLDEKRLI